MGDLISSSVLGGGAAGEADPEAGAIMLCGVAYLAICGSSYCVEVIAPLLPRLSLILKSCRSSSNSEMEFFFIRSMMALISFRSTEPLSFNFDPTAPVLPDPEIHPAPQTDHRCYSLDNS